LFGFSVIAFTAMVIAGREQSVSRHRDLSPLLAPSTQAKSPADDRIHIIGEET
jgi:hypothetical protein